MDDDALTAFSALPAADRRAVEKRLTEAQRATLKALLHKQANPPPAPTPDPMSRPNLSPYSPWLRRRLEILLNDGGESAATPAAREALRELTQRLKTP